MCAVQVLPVLVCQVVVAGLILGYFLKVMVYLSFDFVDQYVREKLDGEEQQIQRRVETMQYLSLQLIDLTNYFWQESQVGVQLLEIARVPLIVDFLA